MLIRAGKRQAHQGQDGVEKPCGLAQRQVQEQPERARGLDRDIGIDRLSATLSGHRRSPDREDIVTDPEGEVATIPPGLILLPPVIDAISGFVFGTSMGSFMGLRHALHRWLSGLIMSKA